jgi:hypothetical protein
MYTKPMAAKIAVQVIESQTTDAFLRLLNKFLG